MSIEKRFEEKKIYWKKYYKFRKLFEIFYAELFCNFEFFILKMALEIKKIT